MATTPTTPTPFQFPQFTTPFPYSSLPDQLQASFAPPNGQFTNGSQYGRWNGVNNNAFGLFPNQFQPLFGTTPGGTQMQFQPPWGNNGTLGSNQGPGANPMMPMQGQQVQPMQGQQPVPKIGTDGSMGQPSGLLNPQTFSGGSFTPPPIPNVQGSNQAFSARFQPTGANTQSAELQHALASGRLTGSYAQNLANMPQSFTPAQFNQVAQQNPVLAVQMAAQGDQSYRNAIMQQNGWDGSQMNNFINAYGSGAQPGFNPQAMQLLSSLGVR